LDPVPQKSEERCAKVDAEADRGRAGLRDDDQADQPQHREESLTEVNHDN
jgi:hypothetical protein